MKRGEVWTVASGSGYSGKPRPAVVVQDEAFEGIDSVTVCMFTTTTVDTEIAGVADVRPGVIPSELNGLAESSQIMVDKITTLRVEKVGRRLGELSEADVQALDEALMVYLGLTRRTR
ncbi:MAG: type II toxin-antitoxin system PemK/MazF family toxin [Tepidiformaceae bacterium]